MQDNFCKLRWIHSAHATSFSWWLIFAQLVGGPHILTTTWRKHPSHSYVACSFSNSFLHWPDENQMEPAFFLKRKPFWKTKQPQGVNPLGRGTRGQLPFVLPLSQEAFYVRVCLGYPMWQFASVGIRIHASIVILVALVPSKAPKKAGSKRQARRAQHLAIATLTGAASGKQHAEEDFQCWRVCVHRCVFL